MDSDFDVHATDLRKLNSLTKYPSIPTYHLLDKRSGKLLDETVHFTGTVVGTEKIDGCSARVILLPDGTYIIGSREKLLYAQGDLVGNPVLGIVETLRPLLDDHAARYAPITPAADVLTLYIEVYGTPGTDGRKQYSVDGTGGCRLFDAVSVTDYVNVLDWPAERIASWRDRGSQPFLDEEELRALAGWWDGELELVPRLFTLDATELPRTVEDTLSFLAEHAPSTRVALDGHPPGKAEGIVLRTLDRSVIAKARFTDYTRTLKRRGSS